jgi:hypothetical protein
MNNNINNIKTKLGVNKMMKSLGADYGDEDDYDPFEYV